jgi:hypothetical protein
MASARKLIRKAFVDRLATPGADGSYLTGSQGRVASSVVAPTDADELAEDGPQTIIYTRMEKSDPHKDFPAQGDGAWFYRHLNVIIETFTVGSENIDDTLDDIAQEIEDAFGDWLIPGFESATMRLIETDHDVITEQVSRPIWAVGLTWLVTYKSPWRPRANIDNYDQTTADFLAGN